MSNWELFEDVCKGVFAAGELTLRLTFLHGGFLWFTAGAAWMYWYLRG